MICFYSKERLMNGLKSFCTFERNSYQQNTRESESSQDRIKRWFIRHKYSFKAHNSHGQEQQIVKYSFAIKISNSIECHKFLLFCEILAQQTVRARSWKKDKVTQSYLHFKTFLFNSTPKQHTKVNYLSFTSSE